MIRISFVRFEKKFPYNLLPRGTVLKACKNLLEKELKGLSEEEKIEKLFVLAYGPKESWTPEISGHYDAIVYVLRKKLRAKEDSFEEDSEEISFDTSAAVPTEVSRVVEEVESSKKEPRKDGKSIRNKIGLKGLDNI